MQRFLSVIILSLAFGFWENPAKAAPRYVPLASVLAEVGIVIGDTSPGGISARTNWYCTSSIGKRVYAGKTYVYQNFFFYPWEQVKLAREGYGQLMVIKGTTRCNPGEVPHVVWDKMRYISMYAPHSSLRPFLRIAQQQFEKKPTATTIYCRAEQIGFAWDFTHGDPRSWKSKTYFKKVLAISLREGQPELAPLTASMFWLRSDFQIWGTYVSRDWKCSESLPEVQKGGYKLLTW